jgi:hypothetical protein
MMIDEFPSDVGRGHRPYAEEHLKHARVELRNHEKFELLDPRIRELILSLPLAGEVWNEAMRQSWLDTLAQLFKIVYRES